MLDINWISCVFFHRKSIVRIPCVFPAKTERTHCGRTADALNRKLARTLQRTLTEPFFLLPQESSICTSCWCKINFVVHTLCGPPRCHFVATRRTSRPTLQDTGMQHLEAADNSDRCQCNQLLSGDQGQHGTKCQIDPSPNASASPRCFSACARKTGRPVHAKQEATTWFGENTSQQAIVDVTICDLQHGELRVDMSILSTV